jgi:hypothetical protein
MRRLLLAIVSIKDFALSKTPHQSDSQALFDYLK